MTSKGSSLFLPEVVGFDDVGYVYGGSEVVLQHLQNWLDGAPRGPPHVNNHREPLLLHIFAETSKMKISNTKINNQI